MTLRGVREAASRMTDGWRGPIFRVSEEKERCSRSLVIGPKLDLMSYVPTRQVEEGVTRMMINPKGQPVAFEKVPSSSATGSFLCTSRWRLVKPDECVMMSQKKASRLMRRCRPLN